MLLVFLIIALIFLISGGIGLFHVNINLTGADQFFFYGNLIFGVFTAIGLAIIIFLAIFNREFD